MGKQKNPGRDSRDSRDNRWDRGGAWGQRKQISVMTEAPERHGKEGAEKHGNRG